MVNDLRVAVAGLGNMGQAMALRLLDRGAEVTVWNRTEEKTVAAVQAGARLAASPELAGRSQAVVLLSLGDEDAVERVLFGGLAAALPPGAVVIDTSTVSPRYARAADERLAAAGLCRVEVAIIGNPRQARAGELRIFTAGSEETAEVVRPLLDGLATRIRHVGAPGAAAALKLVFNTMLGVQLAGLAEAAALAERAGLDRDLVLSEIADSGFASMVVKFRADLMARRAYEPAFFRTVLMEKDLRLALAAPGEPGAAGLTVLEGAREHFAAAVSAGDGDRDAAVVAEHVPGGPAGEPPRSVVARAGAGGGR